MEERTYLAIDLKSFYASVECLLRPELREVPMAVCGDPESRHGVILAKNELAKKFGGKDSPSFVNGILAKFIHEERTAGEEAPEAPAGETALEKGQP